MSILLSSITAEQKEVLDKLTREFADGSDISSNTSSGLEQPDVLRFCVARDFDEVKSREMLQNHLQWRNETLPIPKTSSIQKSLQKRRFYYQCQDNNDRPVVYINFLRYVQESYDPDVELSASLYVMENDVVPKVKCDVVGSHSWTMLIDVSGITSPPLAFLKLMNKTYEANYPERLHRMVMFPVNSWVQRIIQGVLVFVDPTTRAKFCFVNSVQELVQLSGVDSVDQLGDDVQKLIASKSLS